MKTLKRVTTYLIRMFGSRKEDEALRLPTDPRPSDHDPRRDGWSCPAVVYGKVCGLPKTPEKGTCEKDVCRRWAKREERKEREEEMRVREERESKVVGTIGRRKVG